MPVLLFGSSSLKQSFNRKRLWLAGLCLLYVSVFSEHIFHRALAQDQYDGLFQSREIYNNNTEKFTKWSRVLLRSRREIDIAELAETQNPAEEDVESTQKKSRKSSPEYLSGNSRPDVPSVPSKVRPRGLPRASQFTKNTRSLGKHRAGVMASGSDSARCTRLNRAKCNRSNWEAFIKDQQDISGKDLLENVNLYLNRSPYIIDPVNWNLPDYWASPDEFFRKDGDCEDYAISKYVTLKRLGFPAEKMRIVILHDENLRVAHAVLAVYLDGKRYILDNQANMILTDDKILHYRPVYSINETGWWLHQKKRFSRF